MEAEVSKEELRGILRARRQRVTEEAQRHFAEELSRRVMAWLLENERPGEGRPVAAYLSAPPEPGTQQLLAALASAGQPVVVPICEPQYQLSWTYWEPGIELAKSPRAPIWEPVGHRYHFTDLAPFRLVLVPGLAVDAHGNRLGQGGGYYDRFLAQLWFEAPETRAIGYLYDEEILPDHRFVATALDMPLEGAFTPSGFRRLG